MALRTKQAKKLLTSRDQRHLTKAGIHSMAAFERQIKFMKSENGIPCFECKHIAKILGLWEDK